MFHKSAHISANKESFHKIFCHVIVHGYRVNLQQKLIFAKLAPKGGFRRALANCSIANREFEELFVQREKRLFVATLVVTEVSS